MRMKKRKEIEKALSEMEARRTSYTLDMISYKPDKSVVYDTDLIRKLEITDTTIHAVNLVLSNKPTS